MIPLEEMRGVAEIEEIDEQWLEKLGEVGEIVTVPAGTYLFREGDPAKTYYILKEGKVVLEFKQANGSVLTEMVGPGMSVGCSALAGLREYTSDARCEEACTLLAWSQSELRSLFNKLDGLGYQMMRACATSLNKRVGGEVSERTS